jgi:hypothetical protein
MVQPLATVAGLVGKNVTLIGEPLLAPVFEMKFPAMSPGWAATPCILSLIPASALSSSSLATLVPTPQLLRFDDIWDGRQQNVTACS